MLKMMKKELIKRITEKKEFSELPAEDVERALAQFNTLDYSDEEKIKLTRGLLQKIYTSYISRQLFSKNALKKGWAWVLKKHLSSRERFEFYPEIYGRISRLLKTKNKVTVVDFGAGVNGFSYNFLEAAFLKVNYLAVEALGQFVSLMNEYFNKNKLNAKAVHMSLFNLHELKKLVEILRGPRIAFMFKTFSSLELFEKDYTKKFLLECASLFDFFVLSSATKSLHKKESFKASGKWLWRFIEDNFKVIDEFEFGGERYFAFSKKDL